MILVFNSAAPLLLKWSVPESVCFERDISTFALSYQRDGSACASFVIELKSTDKDNTLLVTLFMTRKESEAEEQDTRQLRSITV